MATVITELKRTRVAAATNPKNVREEVEGESGPRPTLKELQQRAEALGKAIRKHLERRRRR